MSTIVESIEVAEDPGALWDAAGRFGDVADWHPLLAALDSEGEEPGDVRIATARDGSRQIERLEAVDPGQRAYSYRIEESALPVDNYHALFRIEPSGTGGSIVTWSADFDATADADGTEDKVREFLRAGLEALRDRGAKAAQGEA